MNATDELELYTVAELAALAKRHPQTIRKDIREGRLQIVRAHPRARPRITYAEARRYLYGAGSSTMQTEPIPLRTRRQS